MKSSTEYDNIMEKKLNQCKKQYDDDMLTKFVISKFAPIKKASSKLIDDKILITKSYLIKFLNYYWSRVDAEHKNSSKFSKDDIVNDVLRHLPTNEKMDRFEFYDYMTDYLISKSSVHLLYWNLASIITVHKLHKTTQPNIKHVVDALYNNIDINGEKAPLVSDEYHDIVMKHHRKIQNKIDCSRDYLFDYFGIKTLERSYLQRIYKNGTAKIVERPQHLIMRLAVGIHGYNLDSAFETYELISQRYFTHATPTLFNAGTKRPQMSSCFLSGMADSIESIFETIGELAYISKWSGGIGIHLSGIRSRGSIIRGTNGKSDGIVPLCIVLNWVARYINQGGKRNGSIAVYLEPWHADIFEFVELRSNKGSESLRARDLYLAIWTCDLFMKRVENNEMWSLMCPDQCPGLNTSHGDEFEELYEKYESEGKFMKQVKAVDLWKHIMTSHIETGFPYILYKDSANKKSNQKNLGTIRSSNLCAEIIEYSDEHETAVCNLASICIPRFMSTDSDGNKHYDFKKLEEVTRVCVRNLNNVIDRNYYPTPKTKKSNMRHRPMGIGVQGLADLYNMMGYPFNSKEAKELNKKIFETMYYSALDESKECARLHGRAYETFKGSPLSEGIMQFHMWGLKEEDLLMGFNWEKLKKDIKKHGVRNSLLIALMPTASTSQIMANSECVEPYMSNIFVRSTLAGDFIVVNKNLMKDLDKLGLWTDDIRKKLLIYNGSIQTIKEIPDNIKEIYKTAFEMSLKGVIEQSAERGPFVCQSQSLNLFIDKPDFDILNTALWSGWKMGLKTGMYYYRSVPAVNPIAFGVDVDDIMRLTGNINLIDTIMGGDKKDEDIFDDTEETIDGNVIQKALLEIKSIYGQEMSSKNEVEECLVCGS